MTDHRIVTALELTRPVGFAHAVIPAPSELVFLGGQTALNPEGDIVGKTVAEQFDQAASNLLCAMRAAGCQPSDLVSLQVFCLDVAEYRASLDELGTVWRKHFGRHYPAMGLFGIMRLFDEEAKVELIGIAAKPSGRDA
jgi:enamine deaminase RidA (YjgF/YER057c/UK114 family)